MESQTEPSPAALPSDIDHVPGQNVDIVTDDLIEQAFGPEPDALRPPSPDDDDDEPVDDDDEIIPDGDLDDDDSDHSEDDDEGEEDLDDDDLEDDELDDDEDLEDDEDSDDDDELEDDGDQDDDATGEDSVAAKLSPEELEEIKADPRLSKRLKQLERAFHDRREEVARRDDQVALRESDLQEFMEEIQSVEGAVSFLKEQIIKNPEVTGAAFEAVATDEETAVSFLVEVGLVKPEALDAAVERLEELNSDERAMDLHKRERSLSAKERRTELEQKQRRDSARRTRVIEIRNDIQKFAKREEIHEDDLPDLRRAVAARITKNRSANPDADIDRQELRQLVKDFGEHRRQQERKLLERRGVDPDAPSKPRKKRRSKSSSSESRGQNRTPKSGGGGRRRGARRSERSKKPPPGVDPLDFAVGRAADRHLAGGE